MSSTKKVKARRMWDHPANQAFSRVIISIKTQPDATPCFILPADPASYERMVEQVAWSMCRSTLVTGWGRRPNVFRKEAAQHLASIGITQP